METKGEWDLQQWQRDILAMEDSKDYLNTAWLSICNTMEIPLKKKQMKMLEWALSDEYFILRANDRKVLKRVYERGYYYEEDKEVLNWIRDNILKGKNFIK